MVADSQGNLYVYGVDYPTAVGRFYLYAYTAGDPQSRRLISELPWDTAFFSTLALSPDERTLYLWTASGLGMLDLDTLQQSFVPAPNPFPSDPGNWALGGAGAAVFVPEPSAALCLGLLAGLAAALRGRG